MVDAGCVLMDSTLEQRLTTGQPPKQGWVSVEQGNGRRVIFQTTHVWQLCGLHEIDPTLSSKTGLCLV